MRLATEAAQLGIWTWDLKNDLGTWENLRMYEIFNLPRETEALNAAKFMSDYLHPDDMESFKHAVDGVLQSGERFHFIGRFYRQPDCEVRWIELTGTVRPDKSGTSRSEDSIYVIGTAADVTDRKQAEEAIAEADRKLRQLANTIPQLAWMADGDGDVHWYNERWYEYTGTTAADMEGCGWHSVHDARFLPEVLERWNLSLTTGAAFEMTFPLKGKDGTFRPFYTLVAPLKDADGKVLQWFGTNTDVSTLHKTQEAVQEASRRKDKFLAMLAHELRNPLAPISAAAQLLQIANLDQARIQRTSEVIGRQVRHMAALVDDLMDVSRVTRGVVKIDKSELEVTRIITEAIEQARPQIEAKRHHLTMALNPAPAHVLGDAKRLIQSLVNLLGNAAKYTPEGGHIHVAADVKDDMVLLHVSDNGIGIEPHMQSHIFELFAQGERGPDRSQGGLGIGLALVKSLVEMHGGQITCKSEGRNEGSRFTIMLPHLNKQGSMSASARTPASSAEETGSLRIMVVDDNKDAANMLATYLSEVGHEVMVEHLARRAVERARLEEPQVCLLDIGLPDMDGYQLARALRQQDGMANAILIALTGYGQDQDKDQAFQAGFDHHFAKPVDLALLLTTISHSLSLHFSSAPNRTTGKA